MPDAHTRRYPGGPRDQDSAVGSGHSDYLSMRQSGPGRQPDANRGRAQIISAQAVDLPRFGIGSYHRSGV